MKKIFLILIGVFFTLNLLKAQSFNLNNDLPVNKRIKKGVLSNGMTYYIYNTDVTKNVASYYIIQNVGSILEDNSQQGLAHFLEHMAFNGTKNFPGKGILNTLQKHGAVFGKNINAYTSFDETVYNLDNIPTNVEGLIDTCLLVLHDWSNYLTLNNDEIDAERGVIKEEWRTRQNGGMRIYTSTAAARYNNSKYSHRMPIGLMDIVENFEYQSLKDFYHDWYRTDLQAIAIVGDINIEEIEEKVKKIFSQIPEVKKKKERVNVQIEDNNEPTFKLAMDKEIPYTSIEFSMRHPNSLKNETVNDLKTSLVQGMVSSIINSRIRELAQNQDAPFKYGGLTYSNFTRLSNIFRVFISPKPDKQAEALKVVLQEVIRAKKFGFSKGEIERVIAQFTTYHDNYLKRVNELQHGEIINLIKKNYLENEHLTDPVQRFKLIKQIFEDIDSELLQNVLSSMYIDKNRTILVTGSENEVNLTKESALSIIKSVETDETLTAYVDNFIGKSLMSGTSIKDGKIKTINKNEAIGSTTFILNNEVKVHYKFTNKNKNKVNMQGLSYGGKSLLTDIDLPSANYAVRLADMSGLGDFTSTELKKILTGKTANVWLRLNDFSENIYGSSATNDVETMLQMTYLKFVKPRFDKNMYNIMVTNLESDLKKRDNNLNAIKQDKYTTTLYGKENPKKRLMNASFLNDLSFEKMKEIYVNRFNDISDFEFFIVGDVSAETLKPLLEKYIASIPDIERKETWKDNTVNWLSNKIDSDIYLKMEISKSTVTVNFENEIDYTLKNKMLAKTLGDILKLRYTASLREKEGGTYGAGVWAFVNDKPTEKVTFGVSFDCDPEKVEKLIPIVYRELDKIKNGEILEEDLNKTIASYLKSRKESKELNSYDMSLLINFFRNGYNSDLPINYENIVNSITLKDIQSFAEEITKGAKSYEIVFKPKP